MRALVIAAEEKGERAAHVEVVAPDRRLVALVGGGRRGELDVELGDHRVHAERGERGERGCERALGRELEGLRGDVRLEADGEAVEGDVRRRLHVLEYGDDTRGLGVLAASAVARAVSFDACLRTAETYL